VTAVSRSRRSAALRKGDRNQQAIIDTAERLLGTQSLSDLTVEALARGAGISRSSFYFYFGSKDDVVLSLLDRLAGEMDAVIASLGATIAEDPLGSLTAAMQASAEVWRAHGPVLLASLGAAAADERIRATWQRWIARFVDEIAETIRAERARGAAPDVGASPKQAASVLVSAHQQAFAQSVAGDASGLAADEIVSVMVDLFYRAIYAKPATVAGPAR